MDIETIDQEFSQLQAQSQQTTTALTNLATKLQAAAGAGDDNAREWILDLKELAIGIRDEQSQVAALLQALHGFVANQLQAPVVAQPQYQQQYQQPQYQQAPQYQPQYAQGGGGMLSRFLGGGFGRSLATGAGMGAGFGIGEDLINSIF
ncbi:MAG TPA: hypothetical protein VG184_12215 [Acidimicrobiales bacterium]|jgi:hypothetical protein|nr:hypothetical protein [Acidimicrobiales bacterium]